MACVPKKKFQEFEAKYANLELIEKENSTKLSQMQTLLQGCQQVRDSLNKELDDTKQNNRKLILQVTEMSSLSAEQSRDMQEALSKMKEKDLQLKALNEAINKRDSMNIALVSELKKNLGRDNQDIEIEVDKAVVMINIAEKALFKTGEFTIRTDKPQVNRQIAAIAATLKNRPTFDVLIEGHTDNEPYKKDILVDNWDLSAKRATALARIFIEKHGINAAKLIAAGRGEFAPLIENDTPENRIQNRCIRIIVMPNLEEFYGMANRAKKKAK
ncbi:MAG: OmpA family protein [Raineya sp.]